MRQGLNVAYRNTAEEFALRLTTALGEWVHAIVLFGSVARKSATRESDIDVLVVGAEHHVRETVLDIAYAIMEHSHFERFINVIYVDRREFDQLAGLGSPFVSNVVEEGIVLYDDGTFTSVRRRVPTSR